MLLGTGAATWTAMDMPLRTDEPPPTADVRRRLHERVAALDDVIAQIHPAARADHAAFAGVLGKLHELSLKSEAVRMACVVNAPLPVLVELLQGLELSVRQAGALVARSGRSHAALSRVLKVVHEGVHHLCAAVSRLQAGQHTATAP